MAELQGRTSSGPGRFWSGMRCSDRRAVQVVLVRALDLDGHDIAGPQRTAGSHIDVTVDLGRVVLRAPLGDRGAGLVDDDRQALAHLGLLETGADLALG